MGVSLTTLNIEINSVVNTFYVLGTACIFLFSCFPLYLDEEVNEEPKKGRIILLQNRSGKILFISQLIVKSIYLLFLLINS